LAQTIRSSFHAIVHPTKGPNSMVCICSHVLVWATFSVNFCATLRVGGWPEYYGAIPRDSLRISPALSTPSPEHKFFFFSFAESWRFCDPAVCCRRGKQTTCEILRTLSREGSRKCDTKRYKSHDQLQQLQLGLDDWKTQQ